MTAPNPPSKLRIAVLGAGRMGLRHARNVAYRSPRAQLVAVADPKQPVLDAASKELPQGVRYYTDPEDALSSPHVDAVLIASETSTHADLACRAMAAGKHVLLEKPISVDVEKSRPVVDAAAAHPELKVMIGFSRRFDESYAEAKARIAAGTVGRPYLLKSATNDQYDPSGFFVAYSKASGGIYIDCGIHDIDLSRWLLDTANTATRPNPRKEVTRVFASGACVRHPELAESGDCDSGLGIIEYENGAQVSIHLSRTAIHGHDCWSEIFGTDGKLVVNGNPQLNRLEIRDQYGVRSESTPTYYERFREAFVTEVNEFTDCVLDNTPVPTTPQDALEAAKIAMALTYSFRNGKPVVFGDDGEPIYD